jgi:hypothetical protein
MFIGHYAVALAAKKAAPKTSLGTLFFAAHFLDLLWPILLLFEIEHVRVDIGNTAFTSLDFYDYPISHSLLTVLGWSLAFGLIYFLRHKNKRAAAVLGVGVLSHWMLDFVTHRPDMPIAPGLKTYVGLGLWNSVFATVLIEGALFIGAVILYARATKALDRTGQYAFRAFVAFSLFFYVGNILSRQQPPPETALAIGGLSQWLMVPWCYWIDRHRVSAQLSMNNPQ